MSALWHRYSAGLIKQGYPQLSPGTRPNFPQLVQRQSRLRRLPRKPVVDSTRGNWMVLSSHW